MKICMSRTDHLVTQILSWAGVLHLASLLVRDSGSHIIKSFSWLSLFRWNNYRGQFWESSGAGCRCIQRDLSSRTTHPHLDIPEWLTLSRWKAYPERCQGISLSSRAGELTLMGVGELVYPLALESLP
ncbi:hypothetical protein ACFX2I_020112 [Malus domestica]